MRFLKTCVIRKLKVTIFCIFNINGDTFKFKVDHMKFNGI